MDNSSHIVEDIKFFLFGENENNTTNTENFSHGLNFATWAGDGHSFIVTDSDNQEYRITVIKEPK
jgi:hypothetical protein